MGERLVKLRGNRKARRVADEMGISRQSLWLYETGQIMPRESIKRLIADYYGVSIPELFYGHIGKNLYPQEPGRSVDFPTVTEAVPGIGFFGAGNINSLERGQT